MKKTLLTLALMAIGATSLFAQEDTPAISINDKSYDVEYLIKQEKGPGILYRRIRIPGYPLNVNIVEVDLTNPYNRVETMQASETLYKTEGGKFFLYTNGGEDSEYPKENIKRMSASAADKWLLER